MNSGLHLELNQTSSTYLSMMLLLGQDPIICAPLPVFHALTGCDTVSAFSGRDKKTAWNTWEVLREVTEAFEDLLLMQQDMSEATMALLEWFVLLLYDRTSDIMNVNDARKQLFTQKSRSLENLPPSQQALKQHIKRACFQYNCWNKTLLSTQVFPVQQTGAGNWVQQGGSHCGQFSLKHHCPAMS